MKYAPSLSTIVTVASPPPGRMSTPFSAVSVALNLSLLSTVVSSLIVTDTV